MLSHVDGFDGFAAPLDDAVCVRATGESANPASRASTENTNRLDISKIPFDRAPHACGFCEGGVFGPSICTPNSPVHLNLNPRPLKFAKCVAPVDQTAEASRLTSLWRAFARAIVTAGTVFR